jgi:prepilin-type N-terminal cleavage/methylation domain-containing protein
LLQAYQHWIALLYLHASMVLVRWRPHPRIGLQLQRRGRGLLLTAGGARSPSPDGRGAVALLRPIGNRIERQDMKKKQERREGFTLVEVVMVTAVLSVLAALLLVTLGPARKMARVSACTSNLRQIGMAYKMYQADYGQYPPPSAPLLVPYLNGKQSLYCPEDTTFLPNGAATSYEFHYWVPPQFIPITRVRELDPNIVLVDCPNHLGQRALVDKAGNTRLTPPTYPFHLVLRAVGSVERIPLSRIKKVLRVDRHLNVVMIYPGEPGYEEGRH